MDATFVNGCTNEYMDMTRSLTPAQSSQTQRSKYAEDTWGRGEGGGEVKYRTDVTKPPWGAYELVINVVSQWPLRDKCSSWEK